MMKLSAKKVILHTSILDAQKKIIAEAKNEITIGRYPFYRFAGKRSVQTFQVADPHLWSPDAPYLYHAVSEIVLNGKVIDQCNK